MWFAIIIAVSVCTWQTSNDEDWIRVVSYDGKAAAMFPGESTERLKTDRTLAGEVQTQLKEYSADGSLYSLGSTKLPKIAKVFAKDSKILRSTMKGILKEYGAKAVASAKPLKVNGVKAVELRFETINANETGESVDETRHGIAIMAIQNDIMYTASAIVPKSLGQQPLQKFRDGVTFNLQPKTDAVVTR